MFIVFIKIQGRISPINVLQSQKIVFHFVGVLLPCGGFLCVYINPRPRPWLSGCCSYWLYAKKIKFPTSRGNCAQQRYAGRFYTSVWNNNNQGFVFLSKCVVIISQPFEDCMGNKSALWWIGPFVGRNVCQVFNSRDDWGMANICSNFLLGIFKKFLFRLGMNWLNSEQKRNCFH